MDEIEDTDSGSPKAENIAFSLYPRHIEFLEGHRAALEAVAGFEITRSKAMQKLIDDLIGGVESTPAPGGEE